MPVSSDEELDLFLRFQHEVANIMYFRYTYFFHPESSVASEVSDSLIEWQVVDIMNLVCIFLQSQNCACYHRF